MPEKVNAFFNHIVTKIVLVFTLMTSLFGIANQIGAGEPYWIASRDFVRTHVAQVASKIEAQQLRTQVFLARSERSRLENEIANKKVLLDQNPNMPLEVRSAILDQIRTLTQNLEDAKNTLDDLKREQSGRRP